MLSTVESISNRLSFGKQLKFKTINISKKINIILRRMWPVVNKLTLLKISLDRITSNLEEYSNSVKVQIVE